MRKRIPALCLLLFLLSLIPVATTLAGERPGGRGELFPEVAQPASLPIYPPGFSETTIFSGLSSPTVLAFAPNGQVFVGEKSGLVKVYDGLNDPTATIFADLRTNVHDYWDRGLLGLAVDPNYPANPYIYVLYTLDAPIGHPPPVFNDDCADPLGNGCTVGGRLSRVQQGGVEEVLIEDWCQQFPSHSIGTLTFGADGALYVGGGDGASFGEVDYGQLGGNPCADPLGSNPPATAEGGALRSQDLRTAADATALNGAILRVDPATGEALADNPLYGGDVADDDRVIAYGMRNPYRFALRPATDQLWIGDVGWSDWEEINRLNDANDSVVENFGWPCYEGSGRQTSYDSTNITICETLYGEPNAVTPPRYAYHHLEHVVAGDGCPVGSSVISGLVFYESGDYPAQLRGALFFADLSRRCIWLMARGGNGEPNPNRRRLFVREINVVDLKTGPAGDLFYVDFYEGAVRRIEYTPARPPAYHR
ncbi:MAG: PQQ-dependent sugar dehydrogenase [Chloroflexota bacterium]